MDTPRRDESPTRGYNKATGTFIQNVLDRSRMSILEGVVDKESASKILDVFRDENTFGENTHITVRDLKDTLDNQTTSACLRMICDVFRSKPNSYIKLKSALVRTGQAGLLETIERKETECHAELKGQLPGCACTEDSRCPFQEQFMCTENLPPFVSSQSKALQQHLIDLYSEVCDWENPVTGVEQEIITKMYVKPDIKIIRQEEDQSRRFVEDNQRQKENEHIPLSYKEIFYAKEEPCKNIYITGDAGMGKTTFCKKLVHTWCKAIKGISEEGDSAEDLNILKEFMYLFYVNLREVESHYHINDMIKENLLRDGPSDLNVSDILKTEKCLVVLDGLDEWSCPQGVSICRGLNKEIPGRNTMTKNCVYLTTSRNWKFDVINLKSKAVDKHIELLGIGESTHEFAKRMVDNLNSKSQSKRDVSDFFDEVQQKKLASLSNVPVLLTQFLTLWYFFKGLGKSQVQLYCKMLDLLLEQASKHLPDRTTTVTKPVQAEVALPECFNEEISCLNQKQLLFCLSKLAFMSLLNKKKEDSLVFKSSTLDVFCIDKSDISLCLKCGIFTQTRVLGNPTGRFKKYSFLHKKLQEFLAAVYLATHHNVEQNIEQVRQYCDKLNTALEMGQMYMFVCGMNAVIGNQLMKHMTFVVSEDKTVQHYRQSYDCDRLIEDIQTCVMTCVAEGASNGLSINVPLQDYIINEDAISEYDNHAIKQKSTIIRSVHIDTYRDGREPAVAMLQHLQTKHTLEKLWLKDSNDDVSASVLAAVINGNVGALNSLCLRSVDLRQDTLITALLGCIPSLLALQLDLELGDAVVCGVAIVRKTWNVPQPVRITHGQIEQLLTANTQQLTQLHLNLYCNAHNGECRPVLDLSAHTQLQKLHLQYLCVANLHAVAHSVEEVVLSNTTVLHSTLRQFIESLAHTTNKVDVFLHNVKVTEDTDIPVDLEAYLRNFDTLTVMSCSMNADTSWDHLIFKANCPTYFICENQGFDKCKMIDSNGCTIMATEAALHNVLF